MAKTISIADDVYEWMKRRKGDRSFSEVIRDLKEKKSNFSEVNGLRVADWDEAEKALEKASEKSWNELKE